MVGIREKKKKETKDKILSVGKELFFEQGYEDTSAQQIAEKAGLGVGTVYNYFNSKSDIFIEIMSSEFGIDENDEKKIIEDAKLGVADAVNEYINKYMKNLKFFNKKIMRELMKAVTTSFKSNPSFFKKLMSLDYKFMDEMLVLLDRLKENRLLEKDFDTKEAVEIIYGAAMYEILLYTYEDNVSLEDCKDRLRKKVKFIFR